MGVTGLWTVVQPCARPTKLETLNKKRLAVDASIWIYQFLKAVRDKEGNALRNSHVVGFFRRICKLLFFGIKPVFVFDGGAPILKRQTVSSRKARREGRRDDAVRTAGKLLAVQMQRRAEEDDQKRREQNGTSREEEQEEEIPDNPVYVDELQMTAQERTQNRTFKKKDAYHLPHLDADMSNLGAPNDPRIMSHEELEAYARQFHSGEDVAMYDFSKIDFDSAFFTSLPAADRYNILNAARLRSRLRMGYSKEQLDTMFPNRMDFSRFQIERVTERNELTQRLMNLNGMNGEDAQFDQSARVAGEKGKEYVLVKNDGVEGGWALGVVTNRGEGERNKPIDVEHLEEREQEADEDNEELEDEGFEDVPIEGLNRLPARLKKPTKETENLPFDSEEAALRRRRIYEARLEKVGQSKNKATRESPNEQEEESLFVAQEEDDDPADGINELFEDVLPPGDAEEEDELQQAIAMSLETGEEMETTTTDHFAKSAVAGPRIDRPLEFNPKNAKVGRDFAHLTNARAHGTAPTALDDDDDDADDFNLQAGLNESRRTKHKPTTGPRVHGFKRPDEQLKPPKKAGQSSQPSSNVSALGAAFDGPLPFESLNLGSSILGRSKKTKAPEDEGGFEKEKLDSSPKKPLPPWFEGDIRNDVAKQNAIEEHQYEGGDPKRRQDSPIDTDVLRQQGTGEVIDLDAPITTSEDVISIATSEDGEPNDLIMGEARHIDQEVRMTDIADLTRAEPAIPAEPSSAAHRPDEAATEGHSPQNITRSAISPSPDEHAPEDALSTSEKREDDAIDWSDSETGDDYVEESHQPARPTSSASDNQPQQEPEASQGSEIAQPDRPTPERIVHSSVQLVSEDGPQDPPTFLKQESMEDMPLYEGDDIDVDNTYSDADDDDLMRQLATEAEEHARFASSLNAKSYLQNAEEYERELRQLRNQQKKDRRDADEVTHIMITECQQLLRLFGLPYITAPMEAEAQCATLVSLGLVDGIVTDDSDCFLFGGTRIYKNFFNQSKFVECYLISDLEKEYGLTRDKLIRFAHLLGSDYTEGLPSVGPVTALEIISEFETLEKFAEWWTAVQMAAKPLAEDSASPFRKKFRKNASKIFLPTTFPDTRVDHAYLNPEVDSDPASFQWGVPDLDALRSFLMATIGWSQERTDEVLVPVIKDMNRRETEGTQANITQFFGGSVGAGARQQPRADGNTAENHFAPRRRGEGKSSRMAHALERMQQRAQGKENESGAEGLDEQDAVNNDAAGKARKKPRRKKRAAPADDETNGIDAEEDDETGGDEGYNPSKSTRKKGRRR